jgi:hypothetical protein
LELAGYGLDSEARLESKCSSRGKIESGYPFVRVPLAVEGLPVEACGMNIGGKRNRAKG